MNIFKKWKQSWDAYIKRLGESNEKEFGNGPMSCCSVNSKLNQNNNRKPSNR